jgi:hypothetical protein
MEVTSPFSGEVKQHVNMLLLAVRLVRAEGLQQASRQGAKPLPAALWLTESCRGPPTAAFCRNLEDMIRQMLKGALMVYPPYVLMDMSLAELNAVILAYCPTFASTLQFLAAVEAELVAAVLQGEQYDKERTARLPTQPFWDVNHVNHAAFEAGKRMGAKAGGGTIRWWTFKLIKTIRSMTDIITVHQAVRAPSRCLHTSTRARTTTTRDTNACLLYLISSC